MSVETPPILTQMYYGFPQFFQEHTGIIYLMGDERFPPNSFQFIIYHPTLYNLDAQSVVK
jgi:hypothetical protein